MSEDDKRDFVMQLGARGVINRKDFKCWGELPRVGTPEYDEWFKNARKFGAADGHKFVNAVLDQLAERLRAAERDSPSG